MESRAAWQRVVEKTFRRDTSRHAPLSPEEIMDQAQTEMREAQARRRAQVVEAITNKNHLLYQFNDLRARFDNLLNKAELADRRGDTTLAQELRKESQSYEKLVERAKNAMQQAEAQTEEIKKTAQIEEETLRQKTAEALVIRAELRVLELQNTLAGALNALNTAPAAPENWETRKHVLTTSLSNYEADFADALRTSEAAVAALHEKIRAPREKGDRNMVYLLREELEAEEAALTLLQEAHAKARDVRLRVERWAAIGIENAPEQ